MSLGSDRIQLPLAESLEALDLHARTALQILRSTHLEYAHVFQRLELHEPASAQIAHLYRSLAVDPLLAAGNRDYQDCRLAVSTIQQTLRTLLKSFRGKQEYVLAVARRVRDFEIRLKWEMGSIFAEEALGARLMRVKGLVGDAILVMDVMMLAEGAVVRRYGRLAILVLASQALLRDALGANASSVVSRKDVEAEVRESIGVLTGMFGPEMEEVD
ncbi:hypothetical protein HOY80DRAFT_966939 [Tuber brumale]|nr:hypothetical protein HOY80DRAFT_966939 [Tuber brumale]